MDKLQESMDIVLYSLIILMCIVIMLLIYFRDAKQRNNDVKHILFTRVLFSNILFFCADLAWGLISLLYSKIMAINWSVNIMYFTLAGLTGYFWLDYVENVINPSNHFSHVRTFFRLLPVVLILVLSLISIKTHWLFYFNATNGAYQRGNSFLYYILPLLSYCLPVYGTIKAVVAATKATSVERRITCENLAKFYIMPFIGGILQIVIKGLPALSIGIMLSCLWMHFTYQDEIIMLDPLTSMYNRRYFDKRMAMSIKSYDKNSKDEFYLMIIDVDYFKRINDEFGHAQGDRALITVAETLKAVCSGFGANCARIGGDEFAVCCSAKTPGVIDVLCETIKQALNEASKRYPFKLKLSFGCAKYSDDITAQQLFVLADKKLYEAKKKR